jgi:hypothetical protein
MSEQPLVAQPKSRDRLLRGLTLLRSHLDLPDGAIEVFEQEDPELHYWELHHSETLLPTAKPIVEVVQIEETPEVDLSPLLSALNAMGERFGEYTVETPEERLQRRSVQQKWRQSRTPSEPSLFERISRLAPETGLWPIRSSEWDGRYDADNFIEHSTKAESDPLATAIRGIEYHNKWVDAQPFPLPSRLAMPGKSRSVVRYQDFSVDGLVQADSLLDLLGYGVAECLNNDQTWWQWESLVERFELQVVTAEWHVFGLFMHRPPGTFEDASLLRLELASTCSEPPDVEDLLEGGYFELHL